jgi:hypothetical protein
MVLMKPRYIQLLCVLIVATGMAGIISVTVGVPLLGAASRHLAIVEYTSSARYLYAVNQSSKDRGSISVYDIDAGHRLTSYA